MPVTIQGQEVLTLRECAEVLDLSKRRVQQFVTEGRLEAHKIGHMWYVTKQELDRFAEIPRLPGNRSPDPRTPRKN